MEYDIKLLGTWFLFLGVFLLLGFDRNQHLVGTLAFCIEPHQLLQTTFCINYH
jgi:hypothetical protein